ncbi:hypothetical protein FPQ18DRAFT_323440 [Pyronema domesticum]|nr:hypothetical protein FPQ18DRAFT_323440 [Pyronema domesticum]
MSGPGLSSDELVEDYKSSLDDLVLNSRYEISTLTVIARENIHAAQAIARTLEEHIRNTAPNRKLPALYLLDSIAKNVGTPYTLYFQRNLYQTFMDTYIVVEPPIRRKLEEMLQTWKAPPPGSTSAQPVFASEMTRKIDNALIKARTAALESSQRQMRQKQQLALDRGVNGRTPPPQFRNTPPPPGPNGAAPYPNPNGYEFQRSASGTPNGNTPVQQNVQNIQPAVQQLSINGPPANGSVDTIQSDIARLIESFSGLAAREPLSQENQNRLQALLDLRKILQTQSLPEAQLAIVREQVRGLASTFRPVAPTPPPPPPPPQMPPLPLSTQDLASLLATAAQNMPMNFPGVPTPPPPMSLPVQLPPTPLPVPPPMPGFGAGGPGALDPAALFASLQKAGLLLPPPPPPLQAGAPLPFPLPLPGAMPNMPNMPALPRNMIPQPTQSPAPSQGGVKRDWRSIDVEMNTKSLQIPRHHLIPRLNETLPNKCSSCARRFEDSEKGRKEKRAHLDWHFRVHQRMAESVKRGQNRSWYVDEEEWIKSADDAEDIMVAEPESLGTESTAESRSEDIRKQYVVVPDAEETHKVCPICQEELKYVWHDETEEFVWMDAKQVGGRLFHASCHAEASKDRANGPAPNSRGGTPDSTAGGVKRKAEDEETDRKVKIKSEPA